MFLCIVCVLLDLFIVSSMYLDLRQYYPREEWCMYNCGGCVLCFPQWYGCSGCCWDSKSGVVFSGRTACFVPDGF